MSASDGRDWTYEDQEADEARRSPERPAAISQERIQWAKDEITGWAVSTEQEFCVGADESNALYAELDAVLALIDELAANQRTGRIVHGDA